MKTPKPELLELIAQATKAAGSQAEAARRAGIHPQHVSHYKLGRIEPSPEAVANLAEVAGLDGVEWLARASLWKAEGKPYEEALKKALKKAFAATGGALSMFFPAAFLVESWANVPRCILC